MARRPKPFPRALEPAWDAFWEAWPRKVGKAEARDAFAKAVQVQRADPAFLARAAERQARVFAERGTDLVYLPYPATWLNKRRYEDEWLADPAPAPQADASASVATATAPADPEPDHPLWPLLRGVMDRQIFATWIAPCRAFQARGRWVILAPSAFHRDYIAGRLDVPLRALGPHDVAVGS